MKKSDRTHRNEFDASTCTTISEIEAKTKGNIPTHEALKETTWNWKDRKEKKSTKGRRNR